MIGNLLKYGMLPLTVLWLSACSSVNKDVVPDKEPEELYMLAYESLAEENYGKAKEYLEKIVNALNNPVYPLFLGRRSCPPTLPIVLGIRDGELTSILKTEPSLLENNKPTRIVYDSDLSGVPVRDKPVSFSQLHRQYGYRMKKEEMLREYEHDPMAEL